MPDFADVDIERAYEHGAKLLQAEQFLAVEAELKGYILDSECDPRLLALVGISRLRLGRFSEAIQVLERASRSAPRDAVYHLMLGDAYFADRNAVSALECYRRAEAWNPELTPAVIGSARALALLDRHEAAIETLDRRVVTGDRDHSLLIELANFQTALSQLEEGLATSELAARSYPMSGVAHHNLAAAYGDVSAFHDSLAAASQAKSLGQTGPATRLVEARALQGLGRMDLAEAAYKQILDQSPDLVDALRDQAQMIWMRTGDIDAASRGVIEAVRRNRDNVDLALTLAKVRQFGGDLIGARQVLGAAMRRHVGPNFGLLLFASELAIEAGDESVALEFARTAVGLAPELPRALYCLCDALLAAGKADEAVPIAQSLYSRDATDQNAIVRYATALRLVGDPLSQTFFDYDTYVRPYMISAPDGWPSVSDYLADLKAELLLRHTYVEHPFDQSLRHGGQTPINLNRAREPAISAFASAIDGPIRDHIQHLRASQTPLGARAADGYEIIGAWSVLLRPNGFHHDHIHHLGWLSSAFYVDVPPAPPANPREGWIRFGAPGSRTSPVLAAEHYVQPQPGMLVLFPSYLWHGTVPFSSEVRRLTMAFDVRPKRSGIRTSATP